MKELDKVLDQNGKVLWEGYPNKLRRDENPGYRTDYDPKKK